MSAGLAVPKWAEGIYSNGSLEAAAVMEYEFSSWSEELKRMTGGVYEKSYSQIKNREAMTIFVFSHW